MKVIITFYTVSSALYLEQLLPKRQMPKVVTVPRALSTSCGYAATVCTDDVKALVSLLEKYELEWHSVYQIKEDHDNTVYLPLSKREE